MLENKKLVAISTLVILLITGLVFWFNIGQQTRTNNPSSTDNDCIAINEANSMQCPKDYEGLLLDKAIEKAKNNNLLPKVAIKDGEGQINTDEGSNRILFEIENGVVIKAYFEDNL